ncbi:helix-turn-helix transcriptional regulator [Brevibacillus formosus]|uniref:helix-turn-helix domain-containing protein n=1 Tax=Brevibacillus formosus TaxID=54913 RepID=UPI0018CF4185|nr:helix-turn-helix transcriptional regulator [Brevibacillus formosus]MBG9940593.1 hypothetical protein [Brevibacillus formosus]
MIRIKLREALEKRDNMTMYHLGKLTGIRPNTLSEWYHDKEDVKMIRLDTLNTICNALNCTVGELIEHIPDEPDKK